MIVRGPFDLTYGQNTLADVSEISVDFDHDSEDFQTVQHQTYEIDGPINATVSIQLLRSDVPALAAVLPQYFVAESEQLSTGETVTDEDGAIDVTPSGCDYVYNDLDIVGCGDPGQTMRLVNARTKIEEIENSDKTRQVTVRFIGEPEGGKAAVQFFAQGGLSSAS